MAEYVQPPAMGDRRGERWHRRARRLVGACRLAPISRFSRAVSCRTSTVLHRRHVHRHVGNCRVHSQPDWEDQREHHRADWRHRPRRTRATAPGEAGMTVAVKLTVWPKTDGFGEEVSAMLVATKTG
jgi:hypothetical protein